MDFFDNLINYCKIRFYCWLSAGNKRELPNLGPFKPFSVQNARLAIYALLIPQGFFQ